MGEADFTGRGSDRLVDALVVHGDLDDIARGIRELLQAGADHVCVQPFVDEPHGPADESRRFIRGLPPDF